VEVAQQQAQAARQQVEEAKRQAIAEVRQQVEEAKQAAKIPSLTPGQSVPSDKQQSAVQMDPTDIARLLQAHLKRVGCNSGAVDGNWDTGSKKCVGALQQTREDQLRCPAKHVPLGLNLDSPGGVDKRVYRH
jgi:sRNA-binding protein